MTFKHSFERSISRVFLTHDCRLSRYICLKFVDYTLDNLKPVSDLQMEIAGRLRVDLGIETDIARMKVPVEKARDEMHAESNRLVDAICANNND
ncbi:hypothetical protein GCM10008066_09880 [Oxalicibacterium faecigallinarum]|uniref:Uncharacterized protein n=1 Tax=Oxalicibacterium faecigallinarum TaxID=573741 RepID=A0A8J3APC7_9BURK|nr:hypothetical protein GCM10008066_09880 [Oxalicibacterium faecigallinarum]